MTTTPTQSLVNLDAHQEAPFEEARRLERWDLEQNLLHDDIEVRNLILDVVKEHVPGLDIADSLITGDIVRDITAASQIDLIVHDQARTIINHRGFFDDEGRLRTIDIHLDGLDFRLVRIAKQGDDAVLTFEDRDINRLRLKKGPRKAASRAKVTRAEYILQLIRSTGKKIPVRINELHKKQPIARLTEEQRHAGADARRTGKKRDEVRGKGFPAGFKMKGVSSQMLSNMTVALDEAENQKSSERVMLAMLVAGFGESGWLKSAHEEVYGTHKGVFQADQKFNGPGGPIPASDLRGQARHFLIGGRSFVAGGAIRAVRNHPTWTVGRVAKYVEVSDGSVAYYDSFFKKARKILDAWGGATGSTGNITRRKRYEFKVENRENYWDAIQRMADDVSWRAFFTAGIFYYISEEDLFKSRARYSFGEQSEGVINIDYEQDQRKTAKKASATVRINRWAIPPGICVNITNLGSGSGKWLVQSVRRSLFSSEAVLTLVQPMPERVEPHPGYTQSQKSVGSAGEPSGDPIESFQGVAVPVKNLVAHSNGYTGSHDGVDLITPANEPLYAICDAEVIDVRAGGWWGKSPSGDVSKGDGIIQLRCLVDVGPFKKGMHFGYGHAEHATVAVGETVKAGDMIGKAGLAVAWHTHFMVNGGHTNKGIGDRDPWPFVAYAQRGRPKRRIRRELELS